MRLVWLLPSPTGISQLASPCPFPHLSPYANMYPCMRAYAYASTCAEIAASLLARLLACVLARWRLNEATRTNTRLSVAIVEERLANRAAMVGAEKLCIRRP